MPLVENAMTALGVRLFDLRSSVLRLFSLAHQDAKGAATHGPPIS
jgi:hypothetical protein